MSTRDPIPAVHTPARRRVHPRQRSSLCHRWRRRAWEWAGSQREREALSLQLVLVTLAPGRRPAELIRDRFRLFRWQMGLGSWREALENGAVLVGSLTRRGPGARTALGWVRLALAAAWLQLGSGKRFRAELAAVLWGHRHGPSPRLQECALRLGLFYGQLTGRTEGQLALLEQRRARLERAPVAAARARRPAGSPVRPPGRLEEAERLLVARLDHPHPYLPMVGFSWRFLSELWSGPREAQELDAWLQRARSSIETEGPTETFRASAAAGRPDGRGPQACRPGDRLLSGWLLRGESRPGKPVAPWMAALLSRLAEDRAPDAELETRRDLHANLSRLAAQVPESWARAAALEASTEVALWLAPDGPAATVEAQEVEAALAQARADLGLAAALLRKLGLTRRAERCERRWVRISWPALGARVAEATGTSLPRPATARPSLAWVQRSLSSAGFLTGDPRVLQDLSPGLLLASSPLPVLILGESGTGKEILARALHRWSALRGDFVAIHCGAIPRDLLESELFGHTRGAFTGAGTDKPGLVEAADGGSLFLDEIGEMGAEAQMKMLRVLESGEVRRLGDVRTRGAAVRLIAATHRDLNDAVRTGAFRLDLLHRIRGVTVRLRPLRERRGDIPLLVSHYLNEAADPDHLLRLPETSLACLLGHEWPGNVRELRATLLRAVHLARALGRSEITPDLLGLELSSHGSEERAVRPELPEALPMDRIGEVPASALVAATGLEAVLEEVERRLILTALVENRWNRTHAARSLGGLSRTTLISKMRRLGIGAAPEEGNENEGS